jgi:hypothetical protein
MKPTKRKNIDVYFERDSDRYMDTHMDGWMDGWMVGRIER